MFEKVLTAILKIILILLLLILLLFIFVYMENNTVAITRYSIYSNKLPPIFNNYNIALLSDFHNSDNGDEVLELVENIKPKIIVIAGDIVNMYDTEFDNVGLLCEGLTKIAPVYFSSGNHERWLEDENSFLSFLESKGVNILNNRVVEIPLGKRAINLIGYQDIIYSDSKMRINVLEEELEDLYNKIENKDLFNLLIFHRANYFETVAKYPFDLVLAGHLHGGQINLPFIKPKILMDKFESTDYSKGYYRLDQSQMIASGGLEKNYYYPRIFNAAEVVEVVLKHLD